MKDEIVRPVDNHMVKDTLGIVITAVVYFSLAYVYIFTMYFGTWGYDFGFSSIQSLRQDTVASIIHSFTYTFTFIMMIWSHIQTFKTCAGFLPKGFEMIEEVSAPPALRMLINERENTYYEKVVRRKIRGGELPSFQQFKETKLSPNSKGHQSMFSLSSNGDSTAPYNKLTADLAKEDERSAIFGEKERQETLRT